MNSMDLSTIKQVPILLVAERLGIQVRGKKAVCFGGHDKRTPSLSFVPNKNIWKCFGCGKGGDVISLVAEVLSCDFKTVLDWFAREFSVDVRARDYRHSPIAQGRLIKKTRNIQKQLQSTPREQSEFVADPEIYGWLTDKCSSVSEKLGLEYLKNHGIPLNVAKKFGVRELRYPSRALSKMSEHWGAERVFRCGLAWGERGIPERLIWTSYAILFPFQQNAGIEYIQGRLFKGDPKYLGPRGITKPLYNVERTGSLSAGSIIHICEGIPDALALEAQGLSAVAVLGASSFRAEWTDFFMRYDVVLIPDRDHGGDTFYKSISKYFNERGKTVRRVRIPEGKKDVADVIAELGRKL